jgi:proteic killer suppression protein
VRILFATAKLEKLGNDDSFARKQLGPDGCRKLRRRLDDLEAAASLEDFRHLPGRCHELKGDLAGLVALDLHQGWRLVVEPANDPVPVKPDAGLDWTRVTAIRVVAVEDYHA